MIDTKMTLEEFKSKDIHEAGEVASFAGVDLRTVQRLAQRGELPCFRIGHSWRFSTAKLLEFWGIE